MNQRDRNELIRALAMISDARQIIKALALAEQGKVDRMSEFIKQSGRGQEIGRSAEALTEANDRLSEVDDSLGGLL